MDYSTRYSNGQSVDVWSPDYDYGLGEMRERRRRDEAMEEDRRTRRRANARIAALDKFDAQLVDSFAKSDDPVVRAVSQYDSFVTNVQSLAARGPMFYVDIDRERKRMQGIRDQGSGMLQKIMALKKYGTPAATRFADTAAKIFNSEFDSVPVAPPGRLQPVQLGAFLGQGLSQVKDYLEHTFGKTPANDIITGENQNASQPLRNALTAIGQAYLDPNSAPDPKALPKSKVAIGRFMTGVSQKWDTWASKFTQQGGTPSDKLQQDMSDVLVTIHHRAPTRELEYAESLFGILKKRYDRQLASDATQEFDLARQADSLMSAIDKLHQRAYSYRNIEDAVKPPAIETAMHNLVFTTVSLFSSGFGQELDFDNNDVQDKMFNLLKLQFDSQARGRDFYGDLIKFYSSEENAGAALRRWAESGADTTKGPTGAIFTIDNALTNSIQGSLKNPGAVGNDPAKFVIPGAEILADIARDGAKEFFHPRVFDFDANQLDAPRVLDRVIRPSLFESDGSAKGNEKVKTNLRLLQGAIEDRISANGYLTGNDPGTVTLRYIISGFVAGRASGVGPWSPDELQTSLDRVQTVAPDGSAGPRVTAPRDLAEVLGLLLNESSGDSVNSHSTEDDPGGPKTAPTSVLLSLGVIERLFPSVWALQDTDKEAFDDAVVQIATQAREAAEVLRWAIGHAPESPQQKAWDNAFAAASARLAAKAQGQQNGDDNK